MSTILPSSRPTQVSGYTDVERTINSQNRLITPFLTTDGDQVIIVFPLDATKADAIHLGEPLWYDSTSSERDSIKAYLDQTQPPSTIFNLANGKRQYVYEGGAFTTPFLNNLRRKILTGQFQ